VCPGAEIGRPAVGRRSNRNIAKEMAVRVVAHLHQAGQRLRVIVLSFRLLAGQGVRADDPEMVTLKGLRLAEVLGNGPLAWEEQRRAFDFRLFPLRSVPRPVCLS
jgi:hypothetical protein